MEVYLVLLYNITGHYNKEPNPTQLLPNNSTNTDTGTFA